MSRKFLMVALALVSPLYLAQETQAASGGDQFITAVNGNTLAGINAQGARYYLYFLPGGYATYHAANGDRDAGRWHLDAAGNVCVAWANLTPPLSSSCYRIDINGAQIRFMTKAGTTRLTLKGYVSDVDLYGRDEGRASSKR